MATVKQGQRNRNWIILCSTEVLIVYMSSALVIEYSDRYGQEQDEVQ